MAVILGKRATPGVPDGPENWTQVIATEPSGEGINFTGSGTRKVHVSSSTGSDTTGDGTEAKPYASGSKGLSAIRQNSCDWLLFKRTDVWPNWQFGRFNKKGKSPDEPILIDAYGVGAEPLFLPHALNQSRFFWRLNGDVTDNIIVKNLDVYYPGRDITNPAYDPAQAAAGPYFSQIVGEPPELFWLWENVRIRFAAVGVHHSNSDVTTSYDGSYRGFLRMRRCIIWKTFQANNRWDAGGHAVLVSNKEDALYEECLIHQAGLDTNNPLSFRSTYYHGFYLQASTGKGPDGVVRPGKSVVRDCIITWASYNAIWHRCGGEAVNNYIWKCGGGIGMGYAAGTPPTLINLVAHNVIQAGMGHNGGPHVTDVNGNPAHLGREPGAPGVGVTIWPTVHPGRVTGNIVAASFSNGISATAISFGTQPEATNYPLSHGWGADNNVVSDWLTLSGGVDSLSKKLVDYSKPEFGPPNVIDATNKISLDGITTTTGEVLLDGTRSIETYDRDILGGPGTEDHFAELYFATMRPGSWNPALTAMVLNDYVRVGYNVQPLGLPPPPPPPPPPPEPVTVAALVLIDADADTEIGPLQDGAVLDFATLPTRNLNVRADTSPAVVGSVRFALDGVVVRTESVAPYTLGGDAAPDYLPWNPTVGLHVLVVTPIAADGTAGTPMTINFTVNDTVEPPPPPPPPEPVYRWEAYLHRKNTLYRMFEDDVERMNDITLDECRWVCGLAGITPP